MKFIDTVYRAAVFFASVCAAILFVAIVGQVAAGVHRNDVDVEPAADVVSTESSYRSDTEADDPIEDDAALDDIVDVVPAPIEDPNAPSDENIGEDLTTAQPMYMELTDDEIYLLATIIYLEGGGESIECQYAIGSVILNRMLERNLSLSGVIYQANQFATASMASYTTPDDTQIEIAKDLAMYGPTIDTYVTYFRAGHYHNFSKYMTNYKQIDHTYFSYDYRLKPDN